MNIQKKWDRRVWTVILQITHIGENIMLLQCLLENSLYNTLAVNIHRKYYSTTQFLTDEKGEEEVYMEEINCRLSDKIR